MIMNQKELIIQTVTDTFLSFGLTPQFQSEKEESYLTSTEQVNILMGFANRVKGTIVLGLNKNLALQIASMMTGGKEITVLDEVGKSCLCELLNMIVGATFGKTDPEATSNLSPLSPPTVVIGNNMFLISNQLKAEKLLFKLNENLFYISYYIEE